MSKYLKKISVLATIILLSAQSTTFAVTTKTSTAELYKGTAEQLIKEMRSDKVIQGSIPLYNTKDAESAVLFDLNGGYVIVDESTNEISEFDLDQDNQFINDTSKHYVYGGPEKIYEEKGAKLKNVQTKEDENDKSVIEDSINTFKKNVETKKIHESINTLKTDSKPQLYGEMIGGKIPNIKYNPNGICGSTAVANLLTFFSFNINQKFVPQQYQNSVNSADNGEQFVKSIVPYVEHDKEGALDTSKKAIGSNPNELKAGLSSYLVKMVGYVGPVYLVDGQANPTTSITITKKGLPYVLGLHTMPDKSNPYRDHWVVGVGYVYMQSNPSMPLYYRVINGWGVNSAYVNKGWTDYLVYIG